MEAMKPFLLIILALFFLGGCTTVEHSTRISTTLQAMEFNSVASRYMDRPTFVNVAKMSDGRSVLTVRMDTYGVPQSLKTMKMAPALAETMKNVQITFSRENVAGYINAIDKFVEWAELATNRNDAFTKEIASVPTWANGGKNSTLPLKFGFHSGNDQQHFLTVCYGGTLANLDNQFFTISGAKKLRQLLLAFSSDSLRQTNIDDVYK